MANDQSFISYRIPKWNLLLWKWRKSNQGQATTKNLFFTYCAVRVYYVGLWHYCIKKCKFCIRIVQKMANSPKFHIIKGVWAQNTLVRNNLKTLYNQKLIFNLNDMFWYQNSNRTRCLGHITKLGWEIYSK